METKLVEIRDEGTFIPVIATRMRSGDEAEHYLLRRCGYASDSPSVLLTALNGDGRAEWSDYYAWRDRTFCIAHRYIEDHWDEIKSGDVVDVEFVLGESESPKQRDRKSTRLNSSHVRIS